MLLTQDIKQDMTRQQPSLQFLYELHMVKIAVKIPSITYKYYKTSVFGMIRVQRFSTGKVVCTCVVLHCKGQRIFAFFLLANIKAINVVKFNNWSRIVIPYRDSV